MQLTNNPDLTFSSIGDEQYRVYEFPDKTQVRINAPEFLNVSKSGGHRILDGAGVSHYIPSGWNHLYWLSKPNTPAFTF